MSEAKEVVIEGIVDAEIERAVTDAINRLQPKPGANGLVPAEEAVKFRVKAMRTVMMMAAGLAAQSKRIGITFTERHFLETAKADYRLCERLEREQAARILRGGSGS